MQVVISDARHEDLEKNLRQLQEDANDITDDPHELSLVEAAAGERHCCVKRLRELRNKVLDIEMVSRVAVGHSSKFKIF